MSGIFFQGCLKRCKADESSALQALAGELLAFQSTFLDSPNFYCFIKKSSSIFSYPKNYPYFCNAKPAICRVGGVVIYIKAFIYALFLIH